MLSLLLSLLSFSNDSIIVSIIIIITIMVIIVVITITIIRIIMSLYGHLAATIIEVIRLTISFGAIETHLRLLPCF